MNQKKYILFVLLLFFVATTAKAQGNNNQLRLPRMFGDNMVLQQGIAAPVWGLCKPADTVRVTIAGNTVWAVAGSNGRWLVSLHPLKSSGPYVLTVIAPGQKAAFKNVMIGEVWLAGGQSNMNFRLRDDKSQKVAEADFPLIREFHVPENVHQSPQTELSGGEWKVCTPANAGDFSAVAYAFASELHRDKHVAVGIIHASKGGTPIETWLSTEVLLSHPDYRAHMLQVAAAPEDWVNNQRIYDSLAVVRFNIIKWANAGLKLKVNTDEYREGDAWAASDYPVMASKMGARPYSFVWLRKIVNIPVPTRSQDFILRLGTIVSGGDVTYFNGVELGHGTMQGNRTYTIPAKLVKPGKNLIAIRFVSEWSSGKLGKDADNPDLPSSDGSVNISLKKDWHYNAAVEPELPYLKSYNKEPAIFFNGMIAPILPYGIRGVLWYQGENNAYDHDPGQYKTLLPLLLSDWRTRWGQGYMPFLFVQLPNFKYASNWPLIREVQLSMLNYPATGVAVTIDSGDPENVHPANKAVVGKRLYLVAKKLVYHDEVVYSAPVYDSFKLAGDSVVIKFSHTENGVVAKNRAAFLTGFTIAGADRVFYAATAAIRNYQIVVSNPKQVPKPVAVRYAWEQNPEASIYNKAGLPASPFRTDNW